jgi:hypothetical protein
MGMVPRVRIRPTVPTLRLRSGQAPLATSGREGWGTQRVVMATVKGEGGFFPETVHFVVVVLPLSRFADYFLHVNMAKCNNCIQTIENKREINHKNGVHLPLKCAILKLELKIGRRFCRAFPAAQPSAGFSCFWRQFCDPSQRKRRFRGAEGQSRAVSPRRGSDKIFHITRRLRAGLKAKPPLHG